MDVNEAARCSGLSRSRIYLLIESGELKSHISSGRRVIYRDDLEAYIASLPAWVPGRDVTQPKGA